METAGGEGPAFRSGPNRVRFGRRYRVTIEQPVEHVRSVRIAGWLVESVKSVGRAASGAAAGADAGPGTEPAARGDTDPAAGGDALVVAGHCRLEVRYLQGPPGLEGPAFTLTEPLPFRVTVPVAPEESWEGTTGRRPGRRGATPAGALPWPSPPAPSGWRSGGMVTRRKG